MPPTIENNKALAFFALLFVSQFVTIGDLLIRRKRIEVISSVYFGILIGVLLAYLMIQALTPVVPPDSGYHTLVVLLTLLILPYVCVSLLLQTKDDFRFVIPYVELQPQPQSGRPLVVDSSSLIDGRIADVVETQIIESQLIVPDFVLAEVQEIADSSDKNRRTRGRRGLEVLAKIQQSTHVDVKVVETSRHEYRMMTVDQKVVALAKQMRSAVSSRMTSISIKLPACRASPSSISTMSPMHSNHATSPANASTCRVIREGDGPGQGVGYLDDGTMVACENASGRWPAAISVSLSPAFCKRAGRMIFGKLASRPGEQTPA
jgi:uncharacterized protein YacL